MVFDFYKLKLKLDIRPSGIHLQWKKRDDIKIPSEISPPLKMTVDCLNDAAAVIDITNESGEEIMLEGKDSWNTDMVGCKWS